MKKITIAAISVGAVVLLAGGGYGIYRVVKNNASPVEVTSVSSLNSGFWGDSMPTSGVITANATQEVYLDSNELIDTVHVQEGDEVKIGDKLLSYDTTLLEIDLEAERLERQSIQLKIKSAKQDLEKLKKITPVSDSYYGDAGAAGGAVLVKTAAVMTAASSQTDTGMPQAESQASQTESQTPQTESQTPQTESQAPQTESQAPQTESQTPQTESQTPETAGGETLLPEGGKGEKETEKSPLSQVKAYGKLNYDSKPYKGSGTKDDPYVFFCKEGTTIYASFMNKLLGYNEAGTSKEKGGMNKDGKGSYAILEIREGDSVSGGFVKSISINGTVKVDKAYAPDVTWTFGSDGVTKNVPEVDEPADDDDDGLFDDGWGDDGWGDDVYTATELKEAIQEKEDEIKDLRLDLREAKLNVKKAQRKLDEATVTATINGVVKTVNDPAADLEGEPFLTVTSSEGMYVKGTISELELGDVQVGSIMTGMSYESGTSFTAEITEISEYPTTADSWYSGQAEASVYPFMAYIEDSDGLSNNEWVDLTIQQSNADTSGIYLYKAYIRSENGQSYVYKADENDRLVKQYIKTGATVYSMYVEVQGGLSLEDRIAFPYGKNVVEGAKIKDSDDTGDAMLY